jgi:glycosyltransferase involved in cell wall biosynthesis
MHILFVPSSYPSDYAPGAGVFVRDQVDCVRRRGHKVGVAYADLRTLRSFSFSSLGRHHFQVYKDRNGAVPLVRWNAWTSRRAAVLTTKIGIRKAFRSYEQDFGRPDLVHAHFGLYGGVAALELKERFGISFVITEHSSGYARELIPAREESLLRNVFAAAERVVVVSQALRKSITPYCEDALVIPNSVDTDFFVIGKAHPLSEFQVTSVGSLSEVKGFDVLLEAFAQLVRDRPAVRLNIVGVGTLRGDLQNLARRLGILDRVTFHGQLSRGDLRALLWSSNLYVSPSRVETFGVAVAEAISCGLPVVATRSGGPQEIITSPSLGTLVAIDDAPNLALEMARAFDSRLDLDIVRAAHARAAMVGRYGSQAIGNRLDDLYREAASRINTGGG